MFFNRVAVSLFEFILSVVMSGFVIYFTYRMFIHANPDFNMEDEIKKGNTAVGVLVGAILYSASTILQRGLGSVVNMFRMFMSAPGEQSMPAWQIILLSAAHLVLPLILALFTISLTLRLFGRLSKKLQAGKELQKGNLAVGVLLAAVVIVASQFVGEGVSAISKALVPQPNIGRIQILR
ncbi:MAG: hypothetical protein AAB320_07995 [Elusimicrobiota bacterium]